MKCNYGISQKLPDGRVCWVMAVERLKRAKQRLKELRRSTAAQYCVYDLRTMEMIAPMRLARATSNREDAGRTQFFRSTGVNRGGKISALLVYDQAEPLSDLKFALENQFIRT